MADLLDDIVDMEVSAPTSGPISAIPSGSANQSSRGKFSCYAVVVTEPKELKSEKQPINVRVMLLGPLSQTITPSSSNTSDRFEAGGFKFVCVPSQRDDGADGKAAKAKFDADPENAGKRFVYQRHIRADKRFPLFAGSVINIEIGRTNNDSLKEYKALRSVKDLTSDVELFETGFVFHFSITEALYSTYTSSGGKDVERISFSCKTFDFVGHQSMLSGDVAAWFNRTLQVVGMTCMKELRPLLIDPYYSFSTHRKEKTLQAQQSVQGKAIKDTKGKCLTDASREVLDRFDVLAHQPPRTQNTKRDFNEKDAELYVTGFEHDGEKIQPPFDVTVMRIKNTTAAPIPDNFSYEKDNVRKPMYKAAGVTRQIVRKDGKVEKQDFATSIAIFDNAMSASGMENDVHRMSLMPFMWQNTGLLVYSYIKSDTATYADQMPDPPRLDFAQSGKPGVKKNTGVLCDLVAAILNSCYGINWDTVLKLFKRGQCFDEGMINVNMKLTGENHFVPIMQTVKDNKDKNKVPAVINLTECKFKLEDLKKAGTHSTFLLFNLAQKSPKEMTYKKLIETAEEMIKEAEESLVAELTEQGKTAEEIEETCKAKFADKKERNLFTALAGVVGETILAALPKHDDDPADYKFPTKDLEDIFALGDGYQIHWTVFAIEKSLLKTRGLENYVGCCVEEDRIWPEFQDEEKRMMIQAHNERKKAAAMQAASSALAAKKQEGAPVAAPPAKDDMSMSLAEQLDYLETEQQLSSPPGSPNHYATEIAKVKKQMEEEKKLADQDMPSLGGVKRMKDDDEEETQTGDNKRQAADDEQDEQAVPFSLPVGMH